MVIGEFCLLYSQLVPDHPQEILAFFNVVLCFNALGRKTVHYTQDASTLVGLGHDYLRGVGCGAMDAHHLGNGLDGVHDVDGEHIFHENDEGMAG